MVDTPRPDLTKRIADVKARVSLGALIGKAVKLTARGRESVGLCPFHQEQSGSFTVVEEKGFAHCFGCGWHGNVIDFVMAHEGLEFLPALERLEGDAGLAVESATRRETARQPSARPDYVASLAAARAVWALGQRARGSVGERWFTGRGIDPDASGALDVIRFLPRCPAGLWRRGESPDDARRAAPALLSPILRISGLPGARALAMRGVHITFLAPDGRGKAQFRAYKRRDGSLVTPPARVVWGDVARGAVLLPAQPLPGDCDVSAELVRLLDAEGELVVGEGLESTLSLMARLAGVRLGCATLNLNNLEGVPLRVGQRGVLPLWRLQGNPARALPFSFTQPGPVTIGVDADMKPTQPQWVQEKRRAAPVKRALSGLERSQHCGVLAACHWRAAGSPRVRVVRPPLGHDFNDLDQAEAA